MPLFAIGGHRLHRIKRELMNIQHAEVGVQISPCGNGRGWIKDVLLSISPHSLRCLCSLLRFLTSPNVQCPVLPRKHHNTTHIVMVLY